MKTTTFNTAFIRVPIASYQTIASIDRTALQQHVQDPVFREALYIASPSLYQEAIQIDFTQPPSQKTKRLYYALIKYLSRYATRCTPFGLFGGFSTLPIAGAPTQVKARLTDGLKKVTRLDMNYLCALAQDLEKHPYILPYLRFFPNSSLYHINNKYRYVAYHYNEQGQRIHHLSSAEKSIYLDSVLNKGQAGASIGELIDTVVALDVDEAVAAEFVEQVVDNQLIVSELEPALTGNNFLRQIIDTLEMVHRRHASEEVASLISRLTSIEWDLAGIEKAPQDHTIEKFTAIESQLAQLSTPFDRKVLFQIDTYLPQATGQLNRGLLNKLIAKLPTLMKLTPVSHRLLGDFMQNFYEKYEDEEVPLVIALDPEIGVGFPAASSKQDVSPLIDGVVPENPAQSPRSYSIPAEHAYLMQKVAEAQLSRAYQIDISEDSLRQVAIQQPNLPITTSAMFSVIQENGREKLVLDAFGGATGTLLLGRFGHTDPGVLNLLQEISRAEDEAQPEVIFADIVHLPQARTGNVIIRPQLKAYQIPYLGKASVDKAHEIPVSDLLISVRGKRILLRSRSLNKQIIPRLSNAHNYSHPDSLDIYNFLSAVQAQHTRLLLGDLSSSFSSMFVFIPRIVLDNLILAEATWNVQASHVKPIVDAFKKNDWQAMQVEVTAWRNMYQIPRYICLADSDNELYVDLENQWLTETFLDEIKSKDRFRIKEFLFRSENATVHSEKGWHSNQFVVAFKNEPAEVKPSVVKQPAAPKPEIAPISRKFFTGSEWIYYKVYTGINTADALLADVLHPLTQRFRAAGWIDKFFFIRYADPGLHFRIRFHFTDPQYVGDVIGELYRALYPYLENKCITAISNDTYNRELERYGRNSIDMVEEYFHVDSQAILHFLSLIEGAEGEECRWRFGMKMLDDLLNLFGFGLEQKRDFAEGNADLFGKEFGYNQALKKQLDARYKEIEGAIHELFAESNEEHQFFYEVCRERLDGLREFAGNMVRMAALGTLCMPLDDLLSSLIHMNVNRLFRSRQRFVEYSLYYHLGKYYRIQYGRTVLARKAITSELTTA